MSEPIRVRRVGETGLLLETTPRRVHALRSGLVRAGLPGVREIVPGAHTVLVVTDPLACDPAEIARRLGDLAADEEEQEPAEPAEITIQVRYDGPDLARVASLTGLTEEEVIARHAAGEYTVAFLGFVPGFGYLDGLDPALHLPRLDTPRPRVPVGSVAIAGAQTCVYAAATPGGWWLLGNTEVVLFDPDRSAPALLSPGTRVRFAPC